jgi:hypothetical protein
MELILKTVAKDRPVKLVIPKKDCNGVEMVELHEWKFFGLHGRQKLKKLLSS